MDLVYVILKKLMSFPLVVDRGICRYLPVIDFLSFRRISKENYNDSVAWKIYTLKLPLNYDGLSYKKKLGLHYLLSWALHFEESVGCNGWLQRIVDWVDYKVSIRLIYSFIFNFRRDFLYYMDISRLSGRQRFTWLRLASRNSRVFKRPLLENSDGAQAFDHPCKRFAAPISVSRNIQQRCR